MTGYLFTDYEPDYDAMWQEFVDLDEQAIFYATHEQEDCPMTDIENPAGKIAGYTAQPDAKVALVNEFKADEERLLRKLDALLPGDNRPIDQKTGERVGEPHVIVDGRWLAIGRTQLQEAFMSINRAVFQPQRIKLPEDE